MWDNAIICHLVCEAGLSGNQDGMEDCGWSLCVLRLLFPSEGVTFKLKWEAACSVMGLKANIFHRLHFRSFFFLPDELVATASYLIGIWQMRMCLSTVFCCCYGHCYLFPSFVWLFFTFLWANLRLCVLEQARGHPVCCLCSHPCTFDSCFPSSLPLFLRPSVGIRDNLVYQASNETQSGPPWPSVSPSLR